METVDFSRIAEAPMDELKSFLQKSKDSYEQIKIYNEELNEKLHRQMKKETRLREEHKQAVLQAETVNMMTKYQLVFVKMENQFAKIFNNNKLRNTKFKQDAFHRVKRCAILRQSDIGFKAQLIFEKFRNRCLNKMINIYTKKNI
jgi:hypothetical protein